MKRVIVAGGRDYEPDGSFLRAMDQFLSTNGLLVCGMCSSGADRDAFLWAKAAGVQILECPADWDRFGRAAGPRRNRQMAQLADVLVAFWDGKSRGTRNMIDEALRSGLEVHVFRYGGVA